MKTGQYRTANQLGQEIKELEAIALRGDLTLPQARRLAAAKDELAEIERATNPNRWPGL